MSINISAVRFRRGSFPRFLAEQLAAHDIDPRYVELELTESLLIHGVQAVLQTLREIKGLGVTLAVKDFGTDCSSLG